MFQRSFKSWSENFSLQMRKDLGLKNVDPLKPYDLSELMQIRIWTPEQIVGISSEAKHVLLDTEKTNWSAVTVSINGNDAVIHNPKHSVGRSSSDLMHEISHLLIGHKPSTVFLSPDGALALRTFDREHEDEASWLAGCLLLPRPALLKILQSRISDQAACRKYGVSQSLLRYRRDITGVSKQFSRRQSR